MPSDGPPAVHEKRANICIRGGNFREWKDGIPCRRSHITRSHYIDTITPSLTVKCIASYCLLSERDLISSCRQFAAFNRDVAFSLTSSGGRDRLHPRVTFPSDHHQLQSTFTIIPSSHSHTSTSLYLESMKTINNQEPSSTSQDPAEFTYPSTYIKNTRHRSKSTSQSPPGRNATNPIPTGNISTADDQNSTSTSSYNDHHQQHGNGPLGISSLLTPNPNLGEKTMDDQQSRPVRGGSEERGRERERAGADENVGNANGSAQSTEGRPGPSPYERQGQGHTDMGPPAGYVGNAINKDSNGNGNNGTGSSTAAEHQRPVEGAPSRAWDDVIDDAIDPILRAALDERSKEHAAAYPWDQGQARAEGQPQAQQRPEAMGINSLMDAEKQSQTQTDPRGSVVSSQNQSRRQEDPRRGGSYPSQGQGQGQGSSFFPRPNDGPGSNGNGNTPGSLEDEYRRRESQSYAMQQQLQQQHYQQQNQQQSGTSSQGQGPPRPEVLRNAPPSLSLNHPLNSARSTNTTSESDVRAIGIQSPRDAYNRNQIQSQDHLGSGSGSGTLSVNVSNGYQELLNRGAGRFGTVAEQAAYRAGFEEAWEYRSKYMEDERASECAILRDVPLSFFRTRACRCLFCWPRAWG